MSPPWSDRTGFRRPRRRSRAFDRAALLAFIPVLAITPVWLLAMTIIWLPVTWLTGILLWKALFGYLLVGLSLFVPTIQRRVLTLLMGVRKPTTGEAPQLQKAFDEVTQAWHIRHRHFVVGVSQSQEGNTDLNAYACGGHLVVVTAYAARELNHEELCGVLAHELCHHLGSHTVALTISQWLTLPVVLLARVGIFLNHVSIAATNSFAQSWLAARLAGRIIATMFKVSSWIFSSGYATTLYLSHIVGRSAEFHADQRVVRMGYGRQLAAALKRTATSAVTSRSHPPARTRIARIEATLRHPHKRHPSLGL